MHDHSDIAADADGPETWVSDFIQLVELQSGLGRIQLKVEGRGLRCLLLVTVELGETGGEGVGDAEVHSGSIFRGHKRIENCCGFFSHSVRSNESKQTKNPMMIE